VYVSHVAAAITGMSEVDVGQEGEKRLNRARQGLSKRFSQRDALRNGRLQAPEAQVIKEVELNSRGTEMKGNHRKAGGGERNKK